MTISDIARNTLGAALTALFDAGGGGHLYIRTGVEEVTTLTADGGTLLSTLPLSATSFAAPAAGVAALNTVTSDPSVAANGTAGHYRLKNAAGVVVAQGLVSAAGGGGDIIFDSLAFILGGTCAVTSGTLTVPA